MPRNGTGTFNIDLTLLPGTTAKASDVNAIAKDLGDEITNSLARDGQGGMLDQFRAIAGSAMAPGLTFAGALTTGFYLESGKVGLAQGGIGFLLENLLPAGLVFDYAGTTPPTGFLLCYGQAVSRTTYAKLFAAIGTTYGAGDGSTTFNLPDYRGVVTAGLDNMGGAAANRMIAPWIAGNTLGAIAGAQFHILNISQMPRHSHIITDPGHGHSVNDPGHRHGMPRLISISGGSIGLSAGTSTYDVETDLRYTGITVNPALTGVYAEYTGGDGAHNNLQPTRMTNKIIFVGLF